MCVHIGILFSQVADAQAEEVADRFELCEVKRRRSKVKGHVGQRRGSSSASLEFPSQCLIASSSELREDLELHARMKTSTDHCKVGGGAEWLPW